MNRTETLDAARQAITVDRAATQFPIESEMQDMDILAIAGGRKDDQGKVASIAKGRGHKAYRLVKGAAQ